MEMHEEYSDIPSFKSDREFTLQYDKIMSATKDTSLDWKAREAAIKQMGGIILSNYSQQFIKLFNSKVCFNLSAQLLDLRSSIMREAGKVVILAAKVYKLQIEPALDKFVSSLILFKLIGSANKLISDTAANCLDEILCHVESAKLLIRLHEQVKNKGNTVRIRASLQFLFCLSNYSKVLLSKHLGIIEEFIHSTIHDANAEVRLTGRQMYFQYLTINEIKAKRLFSTFESQMQKAIKEDTKDETITNNTFSNSYKEIKTIQIDSPVRKGDKPFANTISSYPLTSNLNQLACSNYQATESKSGLSSDYNDTKSYPKTGAKNVISKFKRISIDNDEKINNEFCVGGNYPPDEQVNVIQSKESINPVPRTNIKSSIIPSLIKEDTNYSRTYTKSTNSNIFNRNKLNDPNTILNNYINIINCDKSISNKLEALEFVYSHSEIYSSSDEISENTYRELIASHINNLSEAFPKLVIGVLKNLFKFFESFPNMFNQEENAEIIKLVILNLTSENKLIHSNAESLLNIICNIIDINEFISPVTEIIKSGQLVENSIMFNCFNTLGSALSDKSNTDLTSDTTNNLKEVVDIGINIMTNNIIYPDTSGQGSSYSETTKRKIKETLNVISRKFSNKLTNNISSTKYINSPGGNYNNSDNLKNVNVSHSVTYGNSKINSQNHHENSKINNANNANNTNSANSANSITSPQKNYQITKPSSNNISQIKKIDTKSPSKEDFISIIIKHDSNTLINYLKADTLYNVEKFINSLDEVKYESLLPILNHLNNIFLLSSHDLFIDFESVLIEKIIKLFEKFTSEFSDTFKNILIVIGCNLNKSDYLKTLSKYINRKQSPIIVQSILEGIINVIKFIERETLLDLLPFFIGQLVECLGHSTSGVRKLAVFSIVDLYYAIGKQFEPFLKGVDSTHLNLVNIYLKKKLES